MFFDFEILRSTIFAKFIKPLENKNNIYICNYEDLTGSTNTINEIIDFLQINDSSIETYHSKYSFSSSINNWKKLPDEIVTYLESKSDLIE